MQIFNSHEKYISSYGKIISIPFRAASNCHLARGAPFVSSRQFSSANFQNSGHQKVIWGSRRLWRLFIDKLQAWTCAKKFQTMLDLFHNSLQTNTDFAYKCILSLKNCEKFSQNFCETLPTYLKLNEILWELQGILLKIVKLT